MELSISVMFPNHKYGLVRKTQTVSAKIEKGFKADIEKMDMDKVWIWTQKEYKKK